MKANKNSAIKKHQNGFVHVAILLMMAAMLIICIVTWKVLTKNKEIQPPVQTQNTQQPETKVKILVWKDVPTDLQSAVTKTWGERSPAWNGQNKADCTYSPNFSEYKVNVLENKYAMAGVGCDSGALTIWAKVDSKWEFVESTQFGFTCKNVDKYKIPKELIASWDTATKAKCYNFESQTDREL